MSSIIEQNAANSQNPANAPQTRVTEATRIPMSLPELKLAVVDIPGYHLHWFRGARVPRALQAGYEYVDSSEVSIQRTGLADDASRSGNSDLGSRVSVVAGDADPESGNVERLYLMKIREEWWIQDQKALEAKNERIAATLRGSGDLAANPHGDTSNRYVPASGRQANMFTPKRRS